MEKRISLSLGTRLLILLGMMGAGLVIASVVGVLVLHSGLYAMLIAQDLLAFIIPAIAAMAIFYHKPLQPMCLDRAPSWKPLLVVVAFYIISLPGMNWLVSLNEAMSLPQSMHSVEQWMRASEQQAAALTEQMLDIHSLGQLALCIFVVGIMAGLSEEALFRGALLRTMEDSRLGSHAAVWIAAIVFSAFHMQFFGFLPRMILGVWLGYLLLWTRSLWVPIIAHALNNSTVVIFKYLTNIGIVPEGWGDNLGIPADGTPPYLAIASIIATIALAAWASRWLTHRDTTKA